MFLLVFNRTLLIRRYIILSHILINLPWIFKDRLLAALFGLTSHMEKLEVALAFHDLTVFPKKTFDYLEAASALAREYLLEIGQKDWSEEETQMIENHHKVTPYRGQYSNLVVAFRKSNWVEFYPKTLMPLVGSYLMDRAVQQ